MPRPPNPERRENDGPMTVFVVGILLTMIVGASVIAYYLNAAPWAQGFWEMLR